MDIKRIHPYVESADLEVARDFYVGVFGLEVAMEDPVLALVSRQVPSAQLIIAPEGIGMPRADFGIDVGDGGAVDVAYDRVRGMGMRIVYPLTNEPWGVRRFFVEDPDGRVVNVLAHLQLVEAPVAQTPAP